MKTAKLLLFLLSSAFALEATALAEPMSTRATATVNVSPLRLEFAAQQEDAELLLSNKADQPLSVQVRVFAWSQDSNGEDQYRLSQDYIVSPSIVEVAAGLTQTLHVIAAHKQQTRSELSYRVVVDQLPQSNSGLDGAAQTRLRMTIPLFSGSANAAPAQLLYAVSGNRLSISNVGGRAAKINSGIVVQAERTIALASTNGAQYILPGATRTIPLVEAIRCDGPEVSVRGIIDRKPFDATASKSCV